MTSLARCSLYVSLLVASCASCIGPRAPNASLPYSVRLLGAADGALRGEIRGGRSVFSGSIGRDYAIEVTNNTARGVGFTIVIDGIDAVSGAPVDSCHGLSMWTLDADSRSAARGFFVSDTQISTYRFAPPARALAAIAKGGRRSAIGTIEVCIFSLKPVARPSGGAGAGAFSFRGVVESDEPSPPSPPVVGELRDEKVSSSGAREVDADELVARIVVGYVDEDGAPLGTAPPPAGIVRVVRPPRPEPKQEPVTTAPEPSKPPKGTKPPRRPKPGKPPKDTGKDEK